MIHLRRAHVFLAAAWIASVGVSFSGCANAQAFRERQERVTAQEQAWFAPSQPTAGTPIEPHYQRAYNPFPGLGGSSDQASQASHK